MIPYEVDPSLHNDNRVEPVLDDGFSPPPATEPVPPSDTGVPFADGSRDPLAEKSGF